MERRRFETLLVVVRIVLDAVAINAAFVLAWWIRFASGWLEAPLGQQPLEPYLRALIVITLVWLLVFRACDMYRREAPRSAPDEFYRVLIAATLTMLGLMAMSFLYRGHEFSRLTILIAWVLSVLLAAGLRGGLNAWVRHYQKSRARRRRVAVISLPHAWSPPGGGGNGIVGGRGGSRGPGGGGRRGTFGPAPGPGGGSGSIGGNPGD